MSGKKSQYLPALALGATLASTTVLGMGLISMPALATEADSVDVASGEATQTPPSGSLTNTTESSSGITYLDDKGAIQTLNETAREVSANDTEWSDGWYVSNGTLTIGKVDNNQRITVKGDVKLILADSSDLTVWGGISVNEGSSLTIYAQTKFDENDSSAESNAKVGKLTSTAAVEGKAEDGFAGILDGYAGIGGDRRHSAGAITINGGNVVAVGQGHAENEYKKEDGTFIEYARHAAGIGGGAGGTGGHIVINAGKVKATAMGYAGAGIGGGSSASAGDITVNGGVVEARAVGGTKDGNGNGAGIGSGGYTSVAGDGKITITGGAVTAYGSRYGANIGGGAADAGGSIAISGGNVKCEKETGVSSNSSGIGAGTNLEASYQGVKGDIVISGGVVSATSKGWCPAIGGANVMGNLRILGAADVTAQQLGPSAKAIWLPSGNMEISGGTVRAESVSGAGICVNWGSSLFVSGGTVTASGAGTGAGIGSDNWRLGSVVISGGSVTALSKTYAGIGNGSTNGNNSGGGSIVISGGTVKAQGGSQQYDAAPGIGGGNSAGEVRPMIIEISGGVVVALGGTRALLPTSAPGICGTYWNSDTSGQSNTIKLSGGTVTSVGGSTQTSDIGGSRDQNIVITGGSVKVREAKNGVGGMKVTPKDAAGNELVLAKVPSVSSASSVSVNGVPYNVSALHPQLSGEDAADGNLYLYVPKSARSVALSDADGQVSTYTLTFSESNSTMSVGDASKVNSREDSKVSFDAGSYGATYGESALEVAVQVEKAPAGTRALSVTSVDLDKVRLTVTDAGGKELASAEAPVSYTTDSSEGTDEAKLSLDVSKLPVGSYKLKATYGGSSDLKGAETSEATLSVSPKTLALTGVTGVDRAYNGKTSVALTGGTLEGVINGDDVGFDLSAGGEMSDASVGTDKTVTVTGVKLTGAGAGNYTLTQPADVKVTITKAQQVISYAQGEVSKYLGDASFTNVLTQTTVYGNVTYKSGNEKVATVDASSGKVTLVGIGTATITATAADGGDNYSEATASYTLKVDPRPVAPSSPHEATVSRLGRGKVSLSSTSARKGETVTITATPDEGYGVQAVSVTDARGTAVALTKNPNGTYAFVMPDNAVSVSVTFAKTTPATFTDVDETQWYASSVTFVSQAGIMNGYSDTEGNPTGVFGVGEVLTRAEFAGLLFNYAGGVADPNAKNETGLPDVADGAWYTSAANWAVEKGIIHGSDNADGSVTFDPNEPVTLEQMVAILARLVGADTAKADASSLSRYKDVEGVSNWASQSMAWGSEVGLFSGSVEPDGRYIRSTQDIMRERVAAVIMNACTKGVLK